MTPDWLVKLGIEKIQQKEHGPDVSWLIEELECRLVTSQEKIHDPELPRGVHVKNSKETLICKNCKQLIWMGQLYNQDPSGVNHYQSRDCYKVHEKTQETKTSRENTLDDSGDFKQT